MVQKNCLRGLWLKVPPITVMDLLSRFCFAVSSFTGIFRDKCQENFYLLHAPRVNWITTVKRPMLDERQRDVPFAVTKLYHENTIMKKVK
jgi:hypothetical protein